MATFTNRATLTYSGRTTDSNVVTGTIQETLSASKTAVLEEYSVNDTVTYVINLINSGNVGFNGLTVTDDLGGYPFDGDTLYPLTYVEDSIQYFVNGIPQAAPTVEAGPPLAVSGLNVPANSNAALIYMAVVNGYAPVGEGGTVTNTATVTGPGVAQPIAVSETISVRNEPNLTITKELFPDVVTENGTLTYTFTIRNYGNTAAVATDNLIVTDTFDPILNDIVVVYNGITWTEPESYTYNEATGEFATVQSAITVPAATYEQDANGEWIVTPGEAVLTVTGTI